MHEKWGYSDFDVKNVKEGGIVIANYSRVQKSIENWSVCSKMALGEVGVSLP